MDFEAYETFLENLSSVMRGIDYLINEAVSHQGDHLVWSPIQPDFVAAGELESIKIKIGNVHRNSILPFVLQYLDEDNYVVELTYLIDKHDEKPSFYLSIGH